MSREAVELKYLIERFEEFLDGIGEDDTIAYFDKRDGKVYSFEDRFLAAKTPVTWRTGSAKKRNGPSISLSISTMTRSCPCQTSMNCASMI